jgi:hypothetical protein
MLGGANSLKSCYLDDVFSRRQFHGQGITLFLIARDNLKQKITASPDHVAFANFRPGRDLLFESLQDGLGLRGKPNQGEEHFLEVKAGRINFGVIAKNKTVVFQGAHPAQTRGSRNLGILGQFHVGNTTIGLQIMQDLLVNLVKFDFFWFFIVQGTLQFG